MLAIERGQGARNCQGRSRRSALKAGFLGVLGLSLPDFLRLRAEGSAQARKDTAVGGLRGGQVIGETNAKGEHPVKRPLTPADLLATVYHVLGIDPRRTFQDHTGRPHPILDEGQPIAEAI